MSTPMGSGILIIDDSLTVRMDLAEAFEAVGFRVTACATAGEAREALAREPVALVILDVILPDTDGIEFLRELRSAPAVAKLPVLLLSTEAEVRDRIRGLTTGADEYVGKPYDRGYVVARAQELLRGSAAAAPPAPARVLLIDDSAVFRQVLGGALGAAGYEVMTATNGEEGLRLAAVARPRAILVDGMLPGMDGATVIRRIRLDPALRRTPCLLLTASEDQGGELRALDAGADGFIRKEADAGIILARLNALLRSAVASRAAAEEPASLLGPKKILAVDDSPTYLHELATALSGEGYDVVLARSGEEALEMLSVQLVDCILLDLLMPGLGGKETCQRVKSAPGLRDTPLIMLTAVEDREAMLDGLSTGADDYISKSSDLEVVKARVHAQIRRKQFEDENRRIREELLRKELEAAEARAAQQMAETRAALAAELERKNQELEAFSYSVSHDLRAPLRAIDGFSLALLEDCADRLDATGKRYLQHVRNGAQRMGELIDDLLQLCRVGRAELRRQRVDLSRLARAVVEQLQQIAPDRRLDVLIEDDLMAEADPQLMRVAFENLLGNAGKFTATVTPARIQLGATHQDGLPVYFIRDNGVGFDMKYADKLFHPFQRLHSEAEFPGTGIGLATVHRIIDRHSGRIWADSAVGRGATFYFTIPPEKEAGQA